MNEEVVRRTKEKIITVDDLYEYFGGRERITIKHSFEKDWWLAVTKREIVEAMRGFPVPRIGFKRKDGELVYDRGWYNVPWYDCDDYAFATVGWLRRRLPDKAIWLVVELFVCRKQPLCHATVGFWNSDDDCFWIYESTTGGFRKPSKCEHIFMLIG